MYNVTSRCVRVTITAVKNQEVLHILSVCLYSRLSSVHSACAVLYRHLWPGWLYHIVTHYLTNGMIFEEKKLLIIK